MAETGHTAFDRVGVLGFGTMGAGIAQVVAASGRTVVVLDQDDARLEAGARAVEEMLAGAVRRGKVDALESEATAGRIIGTTEVADLADVDLVIEAVTERPDVKTALLAATADVVGDHAVLTTNTSALSVTDLAAALPSPDRVAGLHFFNPAPIMTLVEVVAALQTDEDVITRLVSFVESLGKDPVQVKDRPGFLVNRLLMPYLNDVVAEYDAGLASAVDIDTALELGLGYKLGPMALLDLIGLDVHLHATTSAYEATRDQQHAPPPLLARMVGAGYHGRKSGRGFRGHYEQEDGA